MVKEIKIGTNSYWITVEPAFDETTGNGFYFAYVANKEPNGLFYGKLVKDNHNRAKLFGDTFSAITYTTDIMNHDGERFFIE